MFLNTLSIKIRVYFIDIFGWDSICPDIKVFVKLHIGNVGAERIQDYHVLRLGTRFMKDMFPIL